MSKKQIGADKSNGVAPVPHPVTYSAGTYTPPTGYKCIGFYVGATAGNVVFNSALGAVTLPVLANSYHSVDVVTITESGTVAGIFALLI